MPPKRSAVKQEQPATASDDSDSSSDISLGSYRRTLQCHRGIKVSERSYSELNLEALLSLLVGVSARLSAAVTSLRLDANADEVRETLRIFEGALRPLSKSLDELTALEGVLLSRMRDLNQTVALCSRRATLRSPLE